MSTKAGLPLFAGGLLAATVMFVPCAPSAAQERPAISTDFSAQQQQENKDQQKKAAPAARPAPQRAPRSEQLRSERLRSEQRHSERPRNEWPRKGRRHVRLPRAARNRAWSLRSGLLRAR